jgi:UDP-glucose 4-epimerase
MNVERVVVTGGSGRVGRYVLRELREHFLAVNADLVPGEVEDEHLTCDVMDLEQVREATKGADAVCHLAAIDYDWGAAPEEYIRVNTLGTWHVLQAAAENGVPRVVLTSSISACGLSEMRPDWRPLYLPVDEAHELRPAQAYSVSKQIMENMGRAFTRAEEMSVICLRPMAVVLPESLDEYLRFVDEPERRWLFYYVTAEDVGRAFRAALAVDGIRFETFFLSAADSSRPEPTLEWYRERIGELPELRDADLYRREPRASIFSSARARDLLGWEPTSDFESLRASAKAGAQ